MPPKRKKQQQQDDVPTPGPSLNWADELNHVPNPHEITQEQAEASIGLTTAQPCKSRVVAYEQQEVIAISETEVEDDGKSRKKAKNGGGKSGKQSAKPAKLSKKFLDSLITDENPPCRAKWCQRNVLCLNHLGAEQASRERFTFLFLR